MNNRFERFLNSIRGRGKPEVKLQDQKGVVIDTDVAPGIGYHTDYSSFGKDGEMRMHATFRPGTNPQEISAAFSEMADRLLANPPTSMKQEFLEDLVEALRAEAQRANPQKDFPEK